MRYGFIVALVAGLALAGAVRADDAKLAFTGMGKGEGHCFKYEMHVELTVQGDKVVGTFQQKGRKQYAFTFPAGADGSFTGVVPVSNGNKMTLTGTATPAGGSIKMTGYCNFAGALAKK
ncbi:MAG TPA: hypothetical protein VMU42_05675 [Candidatus Sulfotelmatobacter sp.]|nr:hypothetical protein [Candidatus Sulfotelmatobacter sp.]